MLVAVSSLLSHAYRTKNIVNIIVNIKNIVCAARLWSHVFRESSFNMTRKRGG